MVRGQDRNRGVRLTLPYWPLCTEAHLAGGAHVGTMPSVPSMVQSCGRAPRDSLACSAPSQDPLGMPCSCQPGPLGRNSSSDIFTDDGTHGPLGGHSLPGDLLLLSQRSPQTGLAGACSLSAHSSPTDVREVLPCSLSFCEDAWPLSMATIQGRWQRAC